MSDVQSNSYVHHTLMNKQDKGINLSTSDSKDHNSIFTTSIQPHQNNSSQNLNTTKNEADSQNPLEWDLPKTLQWMNQNNLADLVDIIRDSKIYGQAFLDLNYKTLRSLNVDSYNDRKRLLRAIKTLVSDSDNSGLSVETQKLDFDTPNSPVTPPSTRHSNFPPESSQSSAQSPSESKPSRFSPNTSTSTLASDSLFDQNKNNKAGYNEQNNSSVPTLSEAFQSISNNRNSNHDSMDNESPTPRALSSHANIQVHNTPGSPDSDTNSSFTVLGPPRFKDSVYGLNSSACLSESSLPMVISPESELADPIHTPSFQLNSTSFDSTSAYKSTINSNSSRPIITPRKESMANLKSRAQNSPFATSPRVLRSSPSSNLLQPTTLDAMLSSQRRSSLYYNAQRLSMIDSDPGPGKVVESVQTTPTLVSKPKLKSKASQESGLLASIFPSIFKKTPKHSRKLSCPEDNAELANILVNLHDIDGTLHPLYLTPPVTPNHLYDTIAAKLHLDPSKSYQFKATTDSITTTVSSKRDIVALLYQSSNQTPLKLDLLPQTPEKPSLPKLQIFSAPIVPNQEKSSFSIASRNPHRPSSTKSPTNTTNAPISPNKPISPSSPKPLTPTPTPNPAVPESTPKPDETPRWAQMWIERPSTDMISDNLDKYFPDQDLDKPVLDPVPQLPSAPSAVSAVPQSVVKEGSLGRKKSIRMVVQEANQRRTSNVKNLSRSNTKLWGSKLTRVNTKKEITNERPVSMIPESPTQSHEPPSVVPSSMADFPLDLIEKQQNQGPPMQWVMGKIIGRGSFGRVFHALNAANGEMLAVKVIELPSAKSQSNLSRKRGDMIRDLYSEIELLKDLEHENIVQYLGFELCPQSINIFLEYVDGGSIESALHRHGPFSEEHCKSLTRQVLKGLEYLHNKNILHRDIKGANVLINSQGVCKISDFGISKKNDYHIAYKNNARMSFKGSVFWMAPEVVRHNGYSAKVDIWSLGCLVIEMLTGQRPWKDLTELAAVYRLGQSSDASTPHLPDSSSDLSREFMKQCFIIEPDHRPTARQLLSHPFCK